MLARRSGDRVIMVTFAPRLRMEADTPRAAPPAPRITTGMSVKSTPGRWA